MLQVRNLTVDEVQKLAEIQKKLTPIYPKSAVPEIEENWKPLFDLMISDQGRVKKEIRAGKRLVRSTLMKWNFTHDGYPCINLSGSTKLVWHLVRDTFLEPEFGMDFIPGRNPRDPSVQSIRLVTDIRALDRRTERMGGCGGKKSTARFTDYDDEFIVSARLNGYPIKVVANYVGCSPAHITKVMQKFQDSNACYRAAAVPACYPVSG